MTGAKPELNRGVDFFLNFPPGPELALMSCTHEGYDVDENTKARYCLNCGLVLNESELVDSPTITSEKVTSFLPISVDYYKPLHSLALSICVRFGLSSQLAASTFAIIQALARKNPRLLGLGRKGRFATAICLLVANRSGGSTAPLSFTDLAMSLNESPFALGKYYYFLRGEAPELITGFNEPGLFIERFFQEVSESLRVAKIPIQKPQEIISLARNICKLGNMAWLDVGRKPEPFNLACLFISLESCVPSLDLKAAFGKAARLKVCESVGVSWRTLQLRIKEIETFLINESKGVLPWDVTPKTLSGSLKDVVRLLLSMESINSDDPPAFKAAVCNYEHLLASIKAAEKRIIGEPSSSVLEEADLIIERLLLKGVKVPEILNCTSTGQLYNLLSSLELDMNECE